MPLIFHKFQFHSSYHDVDNEDDDGFDQFSEKIMNISYYDYISIVFSMGFSVSLYIYII